jgi:hypothetical protein
LLDQPIDAGVNVKEGIKLALPQLAEMYHDGVMARLAKQLGRNKSVPGTWLRQDAAAGWDAICDISYVYQQPVEGIIRGAVSRIAVPFPLTLPLAALPRQGRGRRRPQRHDRKAMGCFLAEVAAGSHVGIKSIGDIASRLKVDVRTLRGLFSAEVASLAPLLEARRRSQREQRAKYEALRLGEAIQEIAADSVRSGRRITRRSLSQDLWKKGVRLAWAHAPQVLSRVKAIAAYLSLEELEQRGSPEG